MNHFEAGLVFCHASGFKPEVASMCYDYAETLIERNGAGDNAKAWLLLEESLSISTELGMGPWKACERSKRGLQTDRSGPLHGPTD